MAHRLEQFPRLDLRFLLVTAGFLPVLCDAPIAPQRGIRAACRAKIGLQAREGNQLDNVMRPTFVELLEITLDAEHRRGFAKMSQETGF